MIFILEHEFLSVFLNTHGFLLLYAHGFYGFHSLFAAVRSQEEHTMLNTWFFWTRISRITRIYLARGSFFFYTHTDLTDLLHEIFFEHEIRRRPTDRREVIERIKRIFLHTDLTDHTDFLHEIFLNTNIPNNTNIICMRIFLFFMHTGLTDLFAYGSS